MTGQLAAQLKLLVGRAVTTGETQQASLARGLNIRAQGNPLRLCLWRTQGQWGPGQASEREGTVCAKQLGWEEHLLSWQGKYLIVTRVESLLD